MASIGSQLLHEYNVRQGSHTKASSIDEGILKEWIKSRSDLGRRSWSKKYKINGNYILVVLSQDCDISCSQDSVDPLVEIAVCIPVASAHFANKYCNSARTLHFELDDSWYEAKSSNIIYIPKSSLISSIDKDTFSVSGHSLAFTFAQWRALRYQRKALPDNFNNASKDALDAFIQEIDEIGSSKAKGVYIRLDSYDEADSYSFEFFILASEKSSDEDLSSFIDAVENLMNRLEDEGVGNAFDDLVANYASRPSTVFVGDLSRLDRLNLDHISLSEDDFDINPTQ